MTAATATHEHPATSLAKFFASHSEAYHRMANAPCGVTNSDRYKMLDIETREIHKLHLKGATVSACARKVGVTPASMLGRFRRRGLEVHCHLGGRKK